MQRLHRPAQDIAQLIPRGDAFIVVDLSRLSLW